MKYGYIALLIGVMTACSAGPGKERVAQRDDPSKGIICTTEVPIGSSLREKRCTTPEEREADRRKAEHQMVIQPGTGNAR
jgi:hypothetical protein